jgi:hypothetical protein
LLGCGVGRVVFGGPFSTTVARYLQIAILA